MMNVELSRFKVKAGKSHVVDEWMKFLNENMDQILLTLKDEKMFVETIFRETSGDEEYLYWYSIQAEGGINVEESQHEVDQMHLEFWYECIDEEVGHADMKTEVVMMQPSVHNAIKNSNI